ncbi:MAG: cytochrome c oxidase subunit 3, partial [Chloroflexota bacterium]
MTQIEDQDLTVTPAPADAAEPGHAGSSPLAHHFRTMAQQFGTAKLGMWLFIATEILMFGGLFCAYGVYRANHPQMFAAGGRLLDTSLGAINTIILITSSFTMALAVRCAQLNQRRPLVAMLALTLLGGVGFMAVKSVEYHSKWAHGLM